MVGAPPLGGATDHQKHSSRVQKLENEPLATKTIQMQFVAVLVIYHMNTIILSFFFIFFLPNRKTRQFCLVF